MAKIDLGRVVGKSAYEIAVEHGFVGTEQEWLDSMFHDEIIPPQASAENQLADKDFVNSSISTATAEFIGTFNSLAELQSTTKTYDNNDYAFVIGKDSNGNTQYSRYKWNGSSWIFEYVLNNSSFTSEQWKAINSNVTDEWRQSINDNKANKDLSNVSGVLPISKGGTGNFTAKNSFMELANGLAEASGVVDDEYTIYKNKDGSNWGLYKFSTLWTYFKSKISSLFHSKEDLNIKRFGQPYGTVRYITIERNQSNLTVGNIEVYNSHVGKWYFHQNGSMPYFFGYSANKNYGLLGYAWGGFVENIGYTKLYLKVGNYGNIGVSAIGTTNNTLVDVSIKISDWTTTAPSGVTFTTNCSEIALKSDLDGLPVSGHTHNSIQDYHDNRTLQFSYAMTGLSSTNWIWATDPDNTNNQRVISPSKLLVGKATGDKNGNDITTTYATKTELSGKANSSHTHDDRYYTESEIDTKLSSKANSSHTHESLKRTQIATGTDLNSLTTQGEYYAIDNTSYPNAPCTNFTMQVIRLMSGYTYQILYAYSSDRIYTRSYIWGSNTLHWTSWKEHVNKNDISKFVSNNAQNQMASGSGIDFNTNKATLRLAVYSATESTPTENGAIFIQKVE